MLRWRSILTGKRSSDVMSYEDAKDPRGSRCSRSESVRGHVRERKKSEGGKKEGKERESEGREGKGIMIHQYREKRPQERRVVVPQHEQEPLQQVLQRLKSSLQLGLKHPPEKMAGKRWCNTDAEVQLQALRAISAFVSALESYAGRPAFLQVPLEDSVATLESLLRAERETIYSKAVDVTVAVVAVIGDGLLACRGKRLVGPLAHLLKCSKVPIVISAATALRGILLRMKLGTHLEASEDTTWKSLEDADVLCIMTALIQEDEDRITRQAALLELCAVIVKRLPEARYKLGHTSSFRNFLLHRCTSSSEAVAQGALRTASALAHCGCVATLMLNDADCLWSTIASCLRPTKRSKFQQEAFRFLTSLTKASSFGASFTGQHVAAIAAGCLRAFEGRRFEGENLMVAAHATSSILSWPGPHHSSFLHNGIEELLLAALSGARNKGDESSDPPQEDQRTETVANFLILSPSGPSKLNPRLRPLLWEILGWLGAHHCVDGELSSSPAKTGLGKSNSNLFVLASTSLLRALSKRGQNPGLFHISYHQEVGTDADGKSLEGQPISAQELVQISKAIFLLLSSPSPSVSSRMRLCLEDALSSHGLDWLPSLVKRTALHVPKTVGVDRPQLIANLIAVACLSWAEECRDQLLKFDVLKIVLGIIQGEVESVDQVKTESLSAMRYSVHSVVARACCFDAESWEGNDSVLFTALWTLPKLLQGSHWVKNIRESMSEELFEKYSTSEDGEFVYMLWKLAGDRNRADGVRWWSVCSLACFGVYGFPSKLGQDFKPSLDDPLLADVIFVLSDGSRLPAHSVMLAARCESLLPAELQAKVCVSSAGLHQSTAEDSDFQQFMGVDTEDSDCVYRSTPAEVHVSSRLTSGVLKILLDYVYAGTVCIPSALMADIKVVAKRCRLEPLTRLLQGKNPVWGQRSAPCNLEPALGMKGAPLADVLLLGGKLQDGVRTKASKDVSDYVRAHRFILSVRCQYFQALFRSGMHDSSRKVLEMQANKLSIMKLLRYLYSGGEKSEVATCAWINLSFKFQLEYLELLLELADLAGYWLLDELQQLTCALIGMYLKINIHLCPPIMSLAAAREQWIIVETCAACMAPVYLQLRSEGFLDSLNDDLADYVRSLHVKLCLSGNLGDALLE